MVFPCASDHVHGHGGRNRPCPGISNPSGAALSGHRIRLHSPKAKLGNLWGRSWKPDEMI